MKVPFLKIVDYFLLIFFSFLYFLVPKGHDPWVIWLCLLTVYFYIFQVLKRPIILFHGIRTFFKIETFFILFYFVIYYLPYQRVVLGSSKLTDYDKNVSSLFIEYTNISIVASTVGLIAFMIGLKHRKARELEVSNYQKSIFISPAFGNRVLSSLNILALVLLYYYFQSGGLIYLFTGGYTGSTTGETTIDGIYVLISQVVMLIVVFIFLFLYNQKKKWRPNIIIGAFISAGWLIILLMSGDRNVFFIIALLGLAIYYSLFKSISRRKLLFLAIGAIITFQIIGITRQLEGISIQNFITAVTNFNDADNPTATSSFENTTLTSRAAFGIVPDRHDYFYGKFKLVGIAGIVPYSRGLFLDSNDPFESSSKTLNYYLLVPHASWGLGSNIITDLYMDFGFLGILVLMWFLGWVAQKSYSYLKKNSNYYLNWVLYFILLANYAEISRYTFGFPIRNIIWTIMLFKLFEFLFRFNNRKMQHN